MHEACFTCRLPVIQEAFWTTALDGILVNGTLLESSTSQAVFDTGTTDFTLSSSDSLLLNAVGFWLLFKGIRRLPCLAKVVCRRHGSVICMVTEPVGGPLVIWQ